jgi:Xaa-Pro dipeptidase
MHKEIRTKLIETFPHKNGIVFVEGVKSDVQRQNRQFLYLSGVFHQVYGHYIVIDLETKKSILFSPFLTDYEAIWHLIKIPTKEELKEEYGVDEVYWTNEFDKKMTERKPSKIFIDKDQKLPSNPTNAPVDSEILKDFIYKMRCIKSEKEIKLMKVVNEVSSDAHLRSMKEIKGGLNEYHIHSLFEYTCHNCGLKNQSYSPIVGAGRNAAVLHYTRNDQPIKTGEIFLIDAGSEYYGYSSDITCTYPVNGKFSPQQSMIYNSVLNVQVAAIKHVKIGMTYPELLLFAHKKLLEELRSNKFIHGEIEELYKLKIQSLFMPHGLGHHIGLDVHDTTKLIQGPILKNMVFTVEPGIYFLPFLFEGATPEQKKHLNMDLIKQFYQFGGVRIEDDIHVTDVSLIIYSFVI